MSEESDAVATPGAQIAAPAEPLKRDRQFRRMNQRLDSLVADIEKIAKPPPFRVADVVQLAALVVGISIPAFGLNDRITDLSAGLNQRMTDLSARISGVEGRESDAERRFDVGLSGVEMRLGAKIDHLSEQITSLNERVARIEGGRAARATRSQ